MNATTNTPPRPGYAGAVQEMLEAAALSRLAGEWWIYQLADGHRYATDDVLVAWEGVRAAPDARTVLDLGAGTGSVGLMALNRLPGARLVAVEVQAVSAALMRRTVAYNGLGERVEVREGDLRAADILAGDERFDLVLANPPFLPPSAGWPPRHPQKAAARFELNGDIFDYCRVAAAHLAPGGRFCFCHAARDPRPERAVAAAGLALLARRDVIFREGKAAHLALFVCSHEGPRSDPPPLVVRDAAGRRTPAYLEVLREMEIVA